MADISERGSRDWWLAHLARRLVAENTRISRLASYLTGNAPLPEGSEGFREAYRNFQRQSRTNFAELIVEAVQERMTPAGFRVQGDDGLSGEATAIWSLNELDVGSSDVHFDMLAYNSGYVMVDRQDPSNVIITREDPACVITEHDPYRPNVVIAALKMYRDEAAGLDHVHLYLPGEIHHATRPAREGAKLSTDASGYEWDDAVIRFDDKRIPIVRFRNANMQGEFETHTDVLDRINYMTLQRLVITAMQAFRQRAVVGELPETDEDGEPIAYDAVFRPGPGALWLLPDGAEMWESSQTDIQPLLTAVKDDLRLLSAVTRTPVVMLVPEGANQSAEGANFGREGLVFKVKDRIKRATYGWNTVMALALGLPDSRDVGTLWLNPDRLSLAECSDAASKLAPIMPREAILSRVMQYSPAEVEEMMQQSLDDAFTLALGSE